MAFHLGLSVAGPAAVDGTFNLPLRGLMFNSQHRDLADDEVYVGQGHHTHRKPRSKSAPTFFDGQHGLHTACLA
eukprot:12425709-Karenia_brevis.AAC.1